MNSITIAGQLGRDAEVRYLPDGKPVVNFSVADNQGKDKDPIWWRCTLWGDRGPKLAEYLTKGQAVTISGTVTEKAYTDKDGDEVVSFDIRVADVALQGGRRESAAPAPRPAPAPARAPAAAPARSSGGFDDMDDDIPFRDPLSYRGVHLAI